MTSFPLSSDQVQLNHVAGNAAIDIVAENGMIGCSDNQHYDGPSNIISAIENEISSYVGDTFIVNGVAARKFILPYYYDQRQKRVNVEWFEGVSDNALLRFGSFRDSCTAQSEFTQTSSFFDVISFNEMNSEDIGWVTVANTTSCATYCSYAGGCENIHFHIDIAPIASGEATNFTENGGNSMRRLFSSEGHDIVIESDAEVERMHALEYQRWLAEDAPRYREFVRNYELEHGEGSFISAPSEVHAAAGCVRVDSSTITALVKYNFIPSFSFSAYCAGEPMVKLYVAKKEYSFTLLEPPVKIILKGGGTLQYNPTQGDLQISFSIGLPSAIAYVCKWLWCPTSIEILSITGTATSGQLTSPKLGGYNGPYVKVTVAKNILSCLGTTLTFIYCPVMSNRAWTYWYSAGFSGSGAIFDDWAAVPKMY